MKQLTRKTQLFARLTAIMAVFDTILLSGISVNAQGYELLAPIPTIGKTTSVTLVEYMKGVFVATIGLAIVLAVIMLVVGGIEYVAAAVPSAKEDAKKKIGGAIGGLLLILMAWVLLQALNPKLLNVGLNLTPVTISNTAVGGGVLPAASSTFCRFMSDGTVLPTGTKTLADCEAIPVTGAIFTCRACPVAGGGVAGVGPGTAKNISATFTKVSAQYQTQIQAACQGKTIPNCESVVAGVIAQESTGVTNTTSQSGAVGVMQLLPANGGSNCSSTDSACIQGQINTGVNQLQTNFNKFGTVPNMLAAYNGGASTIPGTSPGGQNPPMAPSVDCPGLFAWQCNINPGRLAQTQTYVATICGVAECL